MKSAFNSEFEYYLAGLVIAGVAPGPSELRFLGKADDLTKALYKGAETVDNTIKWSSKSVSEAAKQLESGAKSVTVKSRSEAEELFLRMYQGEGYTNTTDMSAVSAKDLLGDKAGTYHWDDTIDAADRISGHGIGNVHVDLPHLQIHSTEGPIIRIFYEP